MAAGSIHPSVSSLLHARVPSVRLKSYKFKAGLGRPECFLYTSVHVNAKKTGLPGTTATLNTLFHVPFSFYTPYYYENIISCLPLGLEYENVFAVANDSS